MSASVPKVGGEVHTFIRFRAVNQLSVAKQLQTRLSYSLLSQPVDTKFSHRCILQMAIKMY